MTTPNMFPPDMRSTRSYWPDLAFVTTTRAARLGLSRSNISEVHRMILGAVGVFVFIAASVFYCIWGVRHD